VEWVVSKLAAAEAVWAALAGSGAALQVRTAAIQPAPGTPRFAHQLQTQSCAWTRVTRAARRATPPNPRPVSQDYALAPSGDSDLDFFCTDWSNELLAAAGIRDDDVDYFKVGGKLLGGVGGVCRGKGWGERALVAGQSPRHFPVNWTPERGMGSLRGQGKHPRHPARRQLASIAPSHPPLPQIPVRGGAEWRQRVRDALASALSKVGTSEASEALVALRLDERAAAEAEAAARAREAEEDAEIAAALFKATQKKNGRGAAGAGSSGARRRRPARRGGSNDGGWEPDRAAATESASLGAATALDSALSERPTSDADSEPLDAPSASDDGAGDYGIEPDSQPLMIRGSGVGRVRAAEAARLPDSEPLFHPTGEADGPGVGDGGREEEKRPRLSAAKRGALQEISRRRSFQQQQQQQPRQPRARARSASGEDSPMKSGGARSDGGAALPRDQSCCGAGSDGEGGQAVGGGRRIKRLRLQPSTGNGMAAASAAPEDDLADF
jgi:hypothetical protein